MNERQEKTADVLGKLTVLGTIVLPMNIITGMWGMNVLVPGQDVENLYWFWSSKYTILDQAVPFKQPQILTYSSHCWSGNLWRFVLLHREASVRHCLKMKATSRLERKNWV